VRGIECKYSVFRWTGKQQFGARGQVWPCRNGKTDTSPRGRGSGKIGLKKKRGSKEMLHRGGGQRGCRKIAGVSLKMAPTGKGDGRGRNSRAHGTEG